MRELFLLACLGIAVNIQAQVDGNYTRDGEAYSFHKDGSFDWIKTSALNVTYGNGAYKIEGKQLTLIFEKARLQPEVQLNESTVTPNEESVLEVRIMYSDGTPVRYSHITLLQSNIAETTNAQGVMKIEISRPLVSDRVVIDVDGRKSAGIPVVLKGHDTLLGIVIDRDIQYKENQSEPISFKQRSSRIKLNGKIFKRS